MAKSFSMITSNMLVIIMAFHEVSGRYAKLAHNSEFLKKTKYDDVFKSSITRESTKYLDFDDNVAINNNEYPEKELTYILDKIEQTEQSPDKERIHIPHGYYLSHLLLSSKENSKPLSDDESCIKSIIIWDLKYLRQHYTIKTENFKQNLTIVKCRENERCGSDATQPLGYESVCTQVYSKIELMKPSVKKEENQELLSMNIPTGCKCTRRRKDDE